MAYELNKSASLQYILAEMNSLKCASCYTAILISENSVYLGTNESENWSGNTWRAAAALSRI